MAPYRDQMCETLHMDFERLAAELLRALRGKRSQQALCRRLGRKAEALASYERALGLTRQEPGRRFLLRRLSELSG